MDDVDDSSEDRGYPSNEHPTVNLDPAQLKLFLEQDPRHMELELQDVETVKSYLLPYRESLEATVATYQAYAAQEEAERRQNLALPTDTLQLRIAKFFRRIISIPSDIQDDLSSKEFELAEHRKAERELPWGRVDRAERLITWHIFKAKQARTLFQLDNNQLLGTRDRQIEDAEQRISEGINALSLLNPELAENLSMNNLEKVYKWVFSK